MIQIAGPNGCGKTTLYKELLEPVLRASGAEWAYINADDIEREMRTGSEATNPGLDPTLSTLAREEADWQREQLLHPGKEKTFIFETVFSDTQGHRLAFMRRAKEAGYFVVMVFVAVRDVMLSSERVKQRALKGGHDVPLETQIARFDRVLQNGRSAVSVADLCLFLDNSGTNTSPAVSHLAVAVFVSGTPAIVMDKPPEWFSQFIAC